MWSTEGPSGWLRRRPKTMGRPHFAQSEPGRQTSLTRRRHGRPDLPRFGSHSRSTVPPRGEGPAAGTRRTRCYRSREGGGDEAQR